MAAKTRCAVHAALPSRLLAGQRLDTGEDALAHADGVAAILKSIGAAPSMRAAVYMVYAGDFLQRPEEVVSKAFGPSYASLVSHTRKLVQIQRSARDAQVEAERRALQTERVRKMLLSFASDLRVVLLRLTSRLQTLRYYATSRVECPVGLARESQDVFAPLANRLGIWQVKWELEDLAFRFLQPAQYREMAALIDGKRAQREQAIEQARRRLAAELAAAGLRCEVQGRPKHLYSVWKKMQGKGIDFAHVFDLRALRVIVDDVSDCYAALSRVHERYAPVAGEFDDYIAKPKSNGYQSLHTVVRGPDGAALEVQIRTRAMHEHAEHGVAAHWAYKEAGARGYAGVVAAGEFEERVAEARRAVLRELLAWQREMSERDAPASADAVFDDRIYVFTPQAAVIELPAGATPLDFAYTLHTSVGHRCRGARVDAALVPLHTPLKNGQTVEIITAKEGGPSRDWLGGEPPYLQSPRARAKVRAWFHAQEQALTVARGREAVEKLLQREGRTALKLEHLAEQLGFKQADAIVRGGGQGRVLAAPHREPAAPAGAAAQRGRHRRAAPHAHRTCHAARRRAGGRGRVAADHAGALLPPGAARRHRRLRDARQGCGHPPQRLQQPEAHGQPFPREAHRRRVGRAAGGGRLRGGPAGRGRRPPGAAARHLRTAGQGEDERSRRAHPFGQRLARSHGVDDLHRRSRRHAASAGRAGKGHAHRRRAPRDAQMRPAGAATIFAFAGA